jgi:hypothetical protein
MGWYWLCGRVISLHSRGGGGSLLDETEKKNETTIDETREGNHREREGENGDQDTNNYNQNNNHDHDGEDDKDARGK